MGIYNYGKSKFSNHKHELGFIILGAITLFLCISLYSYNPEDSSWFYYAHNASVSNWCGTVGAHVAALFFYLFGASSFLLVFLFTFMGYLALYRVSLADEWDRISAWLLLIVTSSALCNAYLLDFWGSRYPGGYIGYGLNRVFFALFDHIGSSIFLYTLLSISIILLFRFSFIGIAQFMLHSLHYIFIEQRAVQRIYQGIKYCIGVIWKGCIVTIQFIKGLLDGSELEETGLIAPDETFNGYKSLPKPKQAALLNFSKEEQSSTSMQTEKSLQRSLAGASLDDQTLFEFEEELYTQQVEHKNSYALPNLDMFIADDAGKHDAEVKRELEERAATLEEKLERFGIKGKVLSIKRGPVVTLFEYQPEIDTKISKILSLEDDLAMALQALSIRILAPIPGRSVVGFEVANKNRKDVLFARAVQSDEFQNFNGSLPLILGEDTIGEQVVADLAKMPHLLIAGSTGSGKSVALNTMLMSLLCKCTPDELKLILIDPKRLEFASYADIAHLLFPIVTDPKQAVPVLRWVVKEMEERYEKMAECGARNIFDYNKMQEEELPFLVVVIDELSDLMMTAGRDIEDLITRITQMARAAGIHMIVATQRPSVDVITGLIKVNFPSRISFRVTSKIDSRTILDCAGADKLLGRGDMLFLDVTTSSLRRVHGAYVSSREIEEVVGHIRAEQQVEYLDITEHIPTGDDTMLMEMNSCLNK